MYIQIIKGKNCCLYSTSFSVSTDSYKPPFFYLWLSSAKAKQLPTMWFETEAPLSTWTYQHFVTLQWRQRLMDGLLYLFRYCLWEHFVQDLLSIVKCEIGLKKIEESTGKLYCPYLRGESPGDKCLHTKRHPNSVGLGGTNVLIWASVLIIWVSQIQVTMGCNMCVVQKPEEQYRVMFQVSGPVSSLGSFTNTWFFFSLCTSYSSQSAHQHQHAHWFGDPIPPYILITIIIPKDWWTCLNNNINILLLNNLLLNLAE